MLPLVDILYTPHGLVSLVAVTIIVTSLVWCLGCCCIIACRRWQKRRADGSTMAEEDLTYVSVPMSSPTTIVKGDHIGTYSSGYASHVETLSYSLQSLNSSAAAVDKDNDHEMTMHTSLDNILTQ